jgi:Protein of unknown function (DUF3551)
MRAIVALTLTFVAALLLSAREPAQAQRGHWCFRSADGIVDCGYYTLAQCKASRPLEATCYPSNRGRTTGGRSQR